MNQPLPTDYSLQQELIERVSALDGKQNEISSNRKSLRATVEALTECTDVDQSVIESIAEQLSVQAKYIEPVSEASDSERRLARNTRIAKYCAITLMLLFAWSMLKWLNINNTIKSVTHEASSLQSQISDFHLRTGRYPHSFESIGLSDNPSPTFEAIKSIEIGPQGQLLVTSDSLFTSQILLTPKARADGWSQWQCSTSASWLFALSSWLCGYDSSLLFTQ